MTEETGPLRTYSISPLTVILNLAITFSIQQALTKADGYSGAGAYILPVALVITVAPFVQGSAKVLTSILSLLRTDEWHDRLEYFLHYFYIIMVGVLFIEMGMHIENTSTFIKLISTIFVADCVINFVQHQRHRTRAADRGLEKIARAWLIVNVPFVITVLVSWFVVYKLKIDNQYFDLWILVCCIARSFFDFLLTNHDR